VTGYPENCIETFEQPEHYEGWDVAPGQIAHNHMGYRTGFPETAFSTHLSATRFALIDVDTKQVALEKPLRLKKTRQGTFQVLDFSEVDRPGTYALKAGDVQTNRDAPHWPSDNWHNPKETWSHSPSDWLLLMTHFFDKPSSAGKPERIRNATTT
jgi:hypothetical protein